MKRRLYDNAKESITRKDIDKEPLHTLMDMKS